MALTQSFLLFFSLLHAGNPAAQASKPLPELDAFLQGIRKNLHSDRMLVSHYTYIDRSTVKELDSNGKVKKTEVRVYEVYPALDAKHDYRKLISRDNKPVSAEEMEKRDRAYSQRIAEEQRKRERESPGQKQRREAKEAESKRKEEESLDEAFRLYKVTMIGREQVEGYPAILLVFEPRADYRPKTLEGKILSKIRGKAWFSEADQELIRIEVELADTISLGLGMIARVHRGAHMTFQRRRVNDEIWLPAESHVRMTGRIFLLKGFRLEQETAYSDYKKFSVETSVSIDGQKKK